MVSLQNETFGMIKSLIDAHTMGINSAANLLRDCGYKVLIAPKYIEAAVSKLDSEENQSKLLNWIKENNICHLGISYRLDTSDAVNIVGKIVYLLKDNGYYESECAIVKSIYFAGLKPACDIINKQYNGKIFTFRGGESAEESLLNMGVPFEDISSKILNGCKYDKYLLEFGRNIILRGEYHNQNNLNRKHYPEFGTEKDSIELRIKNNFEGEGLPAFRAHLGPYSAELSRKDCIFQYQKWCKKIGNSGLLDVLSIGSSQLSQSNFGENWSGKINGGGVPVNSEIEYHDIWKSARPMLVRTYSATKNVKKMAEVYERSIHISWHALSLWWFNELDGRGPNPLYINLKEHIDTIKYIASINKPVEANVPHHFSFRGADDLTYIVSGFLAAKMTKKCGIKTYILQNMLNTPRSTWGIQDIAKGRVLFRLVKELEDENFRVILQTRAGLDYFKPDLDEAKIQLAAVTALMDDIDPQNYFSPEIIHVVSFSEALYLATPEILEESIKITRESLIQYRRLKRKGETADVMSNDILSREERMYNEAKLIIIEMEKYIRNLYSPEGLYLAFISGWLPVPDLWSDSEEFIRSKCWQTSIVDGGVSLVDNNILMPIDTRINKCVKNIDDAKYILKSKYGIYI